MTIRRLIKTKCRRCGKDFDASIGYLFAVTLCNDCRRRDDDAD